MRKSLYSLVLVVLILGTTLLANADSFQSFNVNGPEGVRTLTVDTTSSWVFDFTITLNGGSGSYSGIGAWLIPGEPITAEFTDIFKGSTYTEIFSGDWTGLGWNFGRSYSSYQLAQAPEESSLFELLAVGLGLLLVLPRARKLQRAIQA